MSEHIPGPRLQPSASYSFTMRLHLPQEGGTFAAVDSVILVGSILAQFLLDNKKVETWIVWFAVNVVAIWLYLTSGLAIAGLQYVLFLVTAVLGLRQWWRALPARDVPGRVPG